MNKGFQRAARAVAVVSVSAVITLLATACQTVPNTGPDGDAFYTPPSPVPFGLPGDVIWYHYTSVGGNFAYDAWQVLYHSTSATGQPNVVSGAVIVPTAAWKGPGLRPIVTVAPGTQGLGDSCAPSKSLGGMTDMLNKGWAVAQTDYEGLGTPGDHTYMVGPSQGHAVLDIARAATRLKPVGLKPGGPILISGYSQGGSGATWAGELAPTYAPELDVKGVAAGGVPADLTAVAANLDGSFYFGLLAAAAVGFDAAYPELHLDNYLNAQGKTDFNGGKTQCTIGITLAMANKTIASETTSDPMARPEWQARLAQSYLGTVKPAFPEFLYHGTTDQIIPYAVGTGLRDRYCAKGATVKWMDYSSDHLGTALAANTDVINWLDDRVNGLPAPSSC